MAERPVRIITKQTSVPGRIPTGTTGNELNFIRQGEMAQNTFDKRLFGFDGTNVFEFGVNSFLSQTGGTITGDLRVTGNLSAGTFISGSTNLYDIFLSISNNDITRVQPGLNTYTGGTPNFPTVNVSALTISTLIVSGSSQLATTTSTSFSGGTISGGTLFSGSTNLSLLFQPIGLIPAITSGLNTYTGGTFFNPTVNVSALTISTLVVSGSSQLAITTATSFSANTVSASTYFMATEQIYGTVIKSTAPINTGNTWTRNTDYEHFIYDAIRGKWLSTDEQRLTAVRANNATATQFLRVEDNQVISTTPFRVPYDATITKIVMASSSNDTWQAMITTGSTMGTDFITFLGVSVGAYSAKTDFNVNIISGQTLYIGLSGTSVSQPRVDVYFKRRGQ